MLLPIFSQKLGFSFTTSQIRVICGTVKGQHWNNLDSKTLSLKLLIITPVKSPWAWALLSMPSDSSVTCKFHIFIYKTGKKRKTFGKFGLLYRNILTEDLRPPLPCLSTNINAGTNKSVSSHMK